MSPKIRGLRSSRQISRGEGSNRRLPCLARLPEIISSDRPKGAGIVPLSARQGLQCRGAGARFPVRYTVKTEGAGTPRRFLSVL